IARIVERGVSTNKTIIYTKGKADVTRSLGKLQFLRGFLERAMQTYEEACKLAQSLGNELIESKALLGLGDIHSNKGQTLQANNYFFEAQTRLEAQPADPVYRITTAEILVHKARLAVLMGQLDEAASYLATAY